MQDHTDQGGTGLTCKFRKHHSLNDSRQETAINVLLLLSALLLIAIEQQSLKPQHVLKVRAFLLHTDNAILSTALIKITYTFATLTVFASQKMELKT